MLSRAEADPQAINQGRAAVNHILQGASPAAERLYDYLRSPAGRAILRQYGFVLPED